jgi:hypothetical protein
MTVEMENMLLEEMQQDDENTIAGYHDLSLLDTLDIVHGINEDGSTDPDSEPLF